MEITDALRAAFQDLVLPEIKLIRGEYEQIRTILEYTNKRLDDVQGQLVDLSRRVDETNQRIDRLYEVVVRRDEHDRLEVRVAQMERDLAELKARVAA